MLKTNENKTLMHKKTNVSQHHR